MKRISLNPEELDKQETVDQIADHFQAGEVLAYPTDTVYGLGCLATDENAVERVYKIKQRDKNRSLLVLVANMDMAENHFHIGPRQKRYLEECWPGPYSFILYSKDKLAENLASNDQKLAVRLPNSQFLIRIVKRVGIPVVSTSLNLSGDRPMTALDSLDTYFQDEKPDVVVDIGEMEKTKPSQVRDLTDPENIKIIRS